MLGSHDYFGLPKLASVINMWDWVTGGPKFMSGLLPMFRKNKRKKKGGLKAHNMFNFKLD